LAGDDDTTDPLALANQLCFSVYSAAHAFTRLYRELLDSLGLTYTQYLVLLALWQEDGLSVKRLGEELDLDSGTLTPLLRRLERAGYVQRRRGSLDERCVLVHLTEQARTIRPDIDRARKMVFDATGLSLAEVKDLQRNLESVRAGLDTAAAAAGVRSRRRLTESSERA